MFLSGHFLYLDDSFRYLITWKESDNVFVRDFNTFEAILILNPKQKVKSIAVNSLNQIFVVMTDKYWFACDITRGLSKNLIIPYKIYIENCQFFINNQGNYLCVTAYHNIVHFWNIQTEKYIGNWKFTDSNARLIDFDEISGISIWCNKENIILYDNNREIDKIITAENEISFVKLTTNRKYIIYAYKIVASLWEVNWNIRVIDFNTLIQAIEFNYCGGNKTIICDNSNYICTTSCNDTLWIRSLQDLKFNKEINVYFGIKDIAFNDNSSFLIIIGYNHVKVFTTRDFSLLNTLHVTINGFKMLIASNIIAYNLGLELNYINLLTGENVSKDYPFIRATNYCCSYKSDVIVYYKDSVLKVFRFLKISKNSKKYLLLLSFMKKKRLKIN